MNALDDDLKLLREHDVLELFPISHTTLWELVRTGQFPKPIKLSERVTVWRKRALREFIEGKESDGTSDGTAKLATTNSSQSH